MSRLIFSSPRLVSPDINSVFQSTTVDLRSAKYLRMGNYVIGIPKIYPSHIQIYFPHFAIPNDSLIYQELVLVPVEAYLQSLLLHQVEIVQMFLFHLTLDTLLFGQIRKVCFVYVACPVRHNISTSPILQKLFFSAPQITTLKPFSLIMYFFLSFSFFLFLIFFPLSLKPVTQTGQVFPQSCNITLNALLPEWFLLGLYRLCYPHSFTNNSFICFDEILKITYII